MIAALGHTAGEAEKENEVAATCTAAGSYEEVVCCAVCGEEVSRKTVEVAALGHTEGEAVKENEVAATCLSAGSYEEVICCAVCGEEVSRKTVTVDALGHDYKGVVTDEALCLVPGEMTYTCTRCDDSYTEEIAPLRHSWGETKPGLAPTCTSAGYTSYETCTRCGYSNRDIIPAAGHQGGTATCKEKAVCEVCGESYGELSDHTLGTDYIADEEGHWFACSLCGKELKNTTYAVHAYTVGEQNCTICGVTDSKYFYFTQLGDGTYSIAEQIYNGETILPTGEIKLPNYHEKTKITAIDNGPMQNFDSELGAFCLNEATSITIPEGITTIGPYAFRGCTNLTSIEIPQGVTSIGDYAFEDCTSLEYITIPNSVESIGSNAFSCCALKEIEIPNSVRSIGDWAFEYCEEIVSIDISNVISIGEGIFRDCTALESVTLPDRIETIVDSMFWNCTSLIFEIPNTVKTIGDQAFIGCLFTSITIPDGVTSIGGSTFADCTSLEEITIPNSVTSIGGWAFRGCTSLTSITIPNSVTSIEDRAFEGCDNLTSVVFADATSNWEIIEYPEYEVETTFTPTEDTAANAEALTVTYLEYIWTKQTD